MDKILTYLKKIIFSAFLLYGYNIIASNFNLVIPINIDTIFLITLLGAPGMFALILFKITVL